jgi:hypothetical protein
MGVNKAHELLPVALDGLSLRFAFGRQHFDRLLKRLVAAFQGLQFGFEALNRCIVFALQSQDFTSDVFSGIDACIDVCTLSGS